MEDFLRFTFLLLFLFWSPAWPIATSHGMIEGKGREGRGGFDNIAI